MSIFFWYGYFGESHNTWKSWLSLVVAIIVTGLAIFISIYAVLEVVFDIPAEKTEQFFIELFNKAMASIFTIIGLLVVVCILYYLLGWMSSIPAWAAVIIILLILVLIK